MLFCTNLETLFCTLSVQKSGVEEVINNNGDDANTRWRSRSTLIQPLLSLSEGMSCLSGLVPINIERSIRQKPPRKITLNEEFPLARDLNGVEEIIDNDDVYRKEDTNFCNPWYSPVAINDKHPLKKIQTSVPVSIKSYILTTTSGRKPTLSVKTMDKDNSPMFSFHETKIADDDDEIDGYNDELQNLYDANENDDILHDNSYSITGTNVSKTTCESTTSFAKTMYSAREQLQLSLKKERELRFHYLRKSLQSITEEQLEERKIGPINEACIVEDCRLYFAKIARMLARDVLSSPELCVKTSQFSQLYSYSSYVENILQRYRMQLNDEMRQELANNNGVCLRNIIDQFVYINSIVKKDDISLNREREGSSLVQIEKLYALCKYVLNSFTFEGKDKGSLDVETCIKRQQEIEAYLQMRLSS